MKPRFQFHNEECDPDDVTYRNGHLYIKGKMLERLEERAEAAGVPLMQFIKALFRRMVAHDKEHPDWLQNLIIRKSIGKRGSL